MDPCATCEGTGRIMIEEVVTASAHETTVKALGTAVKHEAALKNTPPPKPERTPFWERLGKRPVRVEPHTHEPEPTPLERAVSQTKWKEAYATGAPFKCPRCGGHTWGHDANEILGYACYSPGCTHRWRPIEGAAFSHSQWEEDELTRRLRDLNLFVSLPPEELAKHTPPTTDEIREALLQGWRDAYGDG